MSLSIGLKLNDSVFFEHKETKETYEVKFVENIDHHNAVVSINKKGEGAGNSVFNDYQLVLTDTKMTDAIRDIEVKMSLGIKRDGEEGSPRFKIFLINAPKDVLVLRKHLYYRHINLKPQRKKHPYLRRNKNKDYYPKNGNLL